MAHWRSLIQRTLPAGQLGGPTGSLQYYVMKCNPPNLYLIVKAPPVSLKLSTRFAALLSQGKTIDRVKSRAPARRASGREPCAGSTTNYHHHRYCASQRAGVGEVFCTQVITRNDMAHGDFGYQFDLQTLTMYELGLDRSNLSITRI